MTGNAFPVDASAGAPAYAALAHRTARSALLMPDAGLAFSARHGMRAGAQPSVGIAFPTVTIQPFACVVDPGSAAGPYLCSFPSAEIVTLNAAPGVGTSRIDGLDVQVPADPPSGTRLATVVYTPGSAAASPSPPAIPARSIRIGTVLTPNSGASTYTPSTTFAVAAGGVLPTPTTGYPGSPFDGQLVYDQTLDQIGAWDGARWDMFTPSAGYARDSTAATLSPASGVDTPITNWQTVMFNTADITYSAGIATVGHGGLYLWMTTVTWPGSSAAYRSRIFAYVNGVASQHGRQSFNTTSAAGVGAQDQTTGFPELLTAGQTIEIGINVSTAGVTGVQPQGFALVRVG